MGEAIPTEVARAIRLIILDVDGVMTDGGIYLGGAEDGTGFELKRFEITDGLGVTMLRRAGIEVAIITGRTSRAVELRAAELGIEEVVQDPDARKLTAAESLLRRKGVEWPAVACVADDLADLPLLRRAGLPVAVANAVPEVRAAARWRTERAGGAGAVREFAEALLKARGEWPDLIERYLSERENPAR